MGSVSQWIGELKEGNDEAARLLWERFYAELVAVARSKLREFPRRVRDEEDFALSAFDHLAVRQESFLGWTIAVSSGDY